MNVKFTCRTCLRHPRPHLVEGPVAGGWQALEPAATSYLVSQISRQDPRHEVFLPRIPSTSTGVSISLRRHRLETLTVVVLESAARSCLQLTRKSTSVTVIRNYSQLTLSYGASHSDPARGRGKGRLETRKIYSLTLKDPPILELFSTFDTVLKRGRDKGDTATRTKCVNRRYGQGSVVVYCVFIVLRVPMRLHAVDPLFYSGKVCNKACCTLRSSLKCMRRFTNEKLTIIYNYMNESYILSSHVKNKMFSNGLLAPMSQGLWLIMIMIMIHAGVENGCVPNFLATWNYEKRLSDKLIPNLPPDSIVVIDNAPNHSVKVNKTPTSSSTKIGTQQLLGKENIPFTSDSLKPTLYALTEQNNLGQCSRPLGNHSHTVLQLPPYHPVLNPIKAIHDKDMINRMGPEDWIPIFKHPKTLDDNYYNKYVYFDIDIDQIITNFNSSAGEMNGTEELPVVGLARHFLPGDYHRRIMLIAGWAAQCRAELPPPPTPPVGRIAPLATLHEDGYTRNPLQIASSEAILPTVYLTCAIAAHRKAALHYVARQVYSSLGIVLGVDKQPTKLPNLTPSLTFHCKHKILNAVLLSLLSQDTLKRLGAQETSMFDLQIHSVLFAAINHSASSPGSTAGRCVVLLECLGGGPSLMTSRAARRSWVGGTPSATLVKCRHSLPRLHPRSAARGGHRTALQPPLEHDNGRQFTSIAQPENGYSHIKGTDTPLHFCVVVAWSGVRAAIRASMGGNGKELAMAFDRDPSQYSIGVISESHGGPKSGWPDRESNPGPPEYGSSVLSLRHLARHKKDNRKVYSLFYVVAGPAEERAKVLKARGRGSYNMSRYNVIDFQYSTGAIYRTDTDIVNMIRNDIEKWISQSCIMTEPREPPRVMLHQFARGPASWPGV
ncbi:hypothetical protein PR048_002228 [Dryococelus australis]|uniref:Transposase n=1 Tax=Dryococelus australis TaxID=614101 RepID=A0ABQ9IJL7_9NEOP|nr:hypothetical protein PR048_002228 [Dryococelus australis]